jgi:hypothetical protein
MTLLAFQRRWLRRTVVSCLWLSASISALLHQIAMAGPWWMGNAANGYQAYGTPPLTPEQQIQRCNTGRLLGGLGGGAVAYAMSREDGRAWAIPLGALLGSQWVATLRLVVVRCLGKQPISSLPSRSSPLVALFAGLQEGVHGLG